MCRLRSRPTAYLISGDILNKKQILGITIGLGIALAGVTFPANATGLSGSGCTVFANTPYMASNAKATANSQMNCGFAISRILQSTLVHVYTFFPNVDVLTVSDGGSKLGYNATASTCDNGGSTTYLTRGEFYSFYSVNSNQAVFNHC